MYTYIYICMHPPIEHHRYLKSHLVSLAGARCLASFWSSGMQGSACSGGFVQFRTVVGFC